MMKYLKIFISGILAGMLIGLGCAINLQLISMDHKILGSLIFGFGLFVIIQFKMFLYTGKVGFVLDNKPNYLIDLLVGLVGNFIGIYFLCSLLSLTRAGNTLIPAAQAIINVKQADSWDSIFVLSIFCGIMIYLAVKGQQVIENEFGKVIVVFLAIMIFILCGFEHCVANVGYYTFAGVLDGKVILYVLLMVLGNSIGSIAVDGLLKLKDLK